MKTNKITVELIFESPIQFQIEGAFVPKARPRVNMKTHQVYMDSTYTTSQELIMRQMLANWRGETIQRANIMCFLRGNLPGDVDNLVGAVLDAMKKGEIIADDTKAVIPVLYAEWEKADYTGALIYLQPVAIPKTPTSISPSQELFTDFLEFPT
jgi:Holliday junction resolvase RusA-like endonuclease